jgi:hypothetical protein
VKKWSNMMDLLQAQYFLLLSNGVQRFCQPTIFSNRW